VLKISCYLHKIYQGYVLANPPSPTGQKLIMVFSYRSAYIFILFTHKNARGGRYTTVLFTQKIPEYLKKTQYSLRSKLPWCFYLSYQMCDAYITIYLHINYRISFHICLPQWLKLSWCLYLNYQVNGVNVIVLFTEITRGGFNKFIPNDQSYHDAWNKKNANILKAKTCQKQYFP